MNSGKILVGILAGVAAGAALGILFAPDKGIDTRKKITKKGDDYVGDVEDKFNNLLERITDKVDGMRKDAVKMADHWKDRIDKVETIVENAKVAAN
jgi:gas vesicle protein